jgi:hypothetical protein
LVAGQVESRKYEEKTVQAVCVAKFGSCILFERFFDFDDVGLDRIGVTTKGKLIG